ncbi:MAG: hypothetical protein RIF41_00385, partial [Polyangiaceae bacterium]
GVVAFELLTGQFPFTGKSQGDVMVNVCTTDPLLPSAIEPRLAPDVDGVMLQMLSKSPSKRPPSASLAIRMLQAATLGGTVASEQTSDHEQEHPLLVGAATVSSPGADTAIAARVGKADTAISGEVHVGVESAHDPTVEEAPAESPPRPPSAALKSTTDPVSSNRNDTSGTTPTLGRGGAWAAIAAAVVVVGGVIGVAAHSGVDDTSVAIDTPSEGGAPTTASAEALDAEPTATSAAPTASGADAGPSLPETSASVDAPDPPIAPPTPIPRPPWLPSTTTSPKPTPSPQPEPGGIQLPVDAR